MCNYCISPNLSRVYLKLPASLTLRAALRTHEHVERGKCKAEYSAIC